MGWRNKYRGLWLLLLLLCAALLFAWVLFSTSFLPDVVTILWRLLAPFILGFALAFVLNLPMKAIETRLLRNHFGKRRRPVALLLTLLLVLVIVALIFLAILPGLVATIRQLAEAMPGYLRKLEDWLRPYTGSLPSVNSWLDSLNLDYKQLASQAASWLQGGAGGFFSGAFGVAASVAGAFVTFFVALFFALYLLAGKEHLTAGLQRTLRAYLPAAWNARLMYVGHICNTTFAHFVSGEVLNAFLTGLLTGVVLWVGGFEYALLIGTLVAVTSLIPLFGGYIACILSGFLLLVSSGLWRTVAFFVVYLVVQQISSSFIYPKVVGRSVSLPAVWVLVGVTVGGGLFGFVGLLLAVPLASILYRLLKENVQHRLWAKGHKNHPKITGK